MTQQEIKLPEPDLPAGSMRVDWDCEYYTASTVRALLEAKDAEIAALEASPMSEEALDILRSENKALRAEVERLNKDYLLAVGEAQVWRATVGHNQEELATWQRMHEDLQKHFEKLQARLKQIEQAEPIGETRENGVSWFDKNPHAFSVGTRFYAAHPAPAQQEKV